MSQPSWKMPRSRDTSIDSINPHTTETEARNQRLQTIERARTLSRDYKARGFHCSEATIRACSEAIGLILPEGVLRSACGFRGGGGGYGDRCGVIEAGCMIVSYQYGRMSPEEELWPYSYLIRTLHQRFEDHFGTLYCRDIKAVEIEKGADPFCLTTYQDGAAIVTGLLYEAEHLLANIPEAEKTG